MTNLFGQKLQAACRLLSAVLITLSCVGTSRAALEITEVMYNPNGDDQVWEWIEVRNTGAEEVNLDGYLGFNLGDDVDNPNPTINSILSEDTVIPAGGVAIIYDGFASAFPQQNYNANLFRQAWGIDPSTPVIAADFWPALGNTIGGDSQSIGFWANATDYDLDRELDPNGQPGEVVGFAHAAFSLDWRNGFPTITTAFQGRSIYWKGTDDINDGANWDRSTVGQFGAVQSTPLTAALTNSTLDVGNPGVIPASVTTAFSGSPGLHFTEIMYAPESANPTWEWVEIYNNSGSAVDLTGYVLDDGNGNRHTSANIAGGMIPDGGVAVLFNSALTLTQFQTAWGAGVNAIPVSNWTNNSMALNNSPPSSNSDPNNPTFLPTDKVGLWSSFASYAPTDPNDPSTGDHQLHANAVATQRYQEDDDYPQGGPASIYFIPNVDFDPDEGLNWALSAVGDGISIDPNTVTISGSPYYPGNDTGSPGTFIAVYDADFNEDDVIDGLDFLAWQRGESPDPLSAGDLALWEDQYGNPSPLQGISAVPEPTTLILCGLALAPLGLGRRRIEMMRL